jgi:N-acetyl-gamma-glutamyl-phosphate reductase
VAATTGSAFADIGVAARNGHGAVMVALDNLGKGMAAQAVQNLNLALGLPEWTGLKAAGTYPG